MQELLIIIISSSSSANNIQDQCLIIITDIYGVREKLVTGY